jgi:hypothetical protein
MTYNLGKAFIMRIYKSTISAIGCLFLLAANIAFANNESFVEFFASNNTKKINMQTAYDRLTGQEQYNLKNNMISILQKNHIEQGKFENILGTYRMSSDQNITADNTENFINSPYQHLSDGKVFSIAKELAVSLHQDSVAVLISDQSSMGDITVSFISRQPGINEVTTLLHDKLPILYNQAFSIHLAKSCGGFNSAKVAEIEWLGSKINIEEVKKAFPSEKINYRYGKVFLVYQNGQRERL